MSVAPKQAVPNGTPETPNPAETPQAGNEDVPDGTGETAPFVDVDAIEPEQPDAGAVIVELAALKAVDYEQRRKQAAEGLGVRATVLDQLVKQARKTHGGDDSDGAKQGREVRIDPPAPWPDPVDGAALLDAIAGAVSDYVIFPPGAADAMALWVVHTHAFEAAFITPRLTFISPDKRCGKTTALHMIRELACKPMSCENITAAALFRIIELAQPTLLIDEADTFVVSGDDLNGILNSGHRQGGTVIRVVGDGHEVRQFATFAPVAIAAINKRLPPTMLDRSIIIEMRRKKPSESVRRFRARHLRHLADLASQAQRWATDNARAIGALSPDPLPFLNDRAADNWETLLAIADTAGGHWPERAREAARLLSLADTVETESTGGMLLTDIRQVFAEIGADRIESALLAERLGKMEGRPWAEWGRTGKPITQNQLARRLRPYDIKPKTVRIGSETPRGYERAQFVDLWERYCREMPDTPLQSATPQQARETAGYSGFQSATRENDVAVSNPRKPAENGDCCGVAVQNGEPWESEL